MTTRDLREKLRQMLAAEKQAMWKAIGAPAAWDDERVIEMFQKEPAWERTICDYLGIPTPGEVVAQATIQQAHDQRRSVTLSWIAIIIAVFALIVTLFK